MAAFRESQANQFQSTPPMRGATRYQSSNLLLRHISIHAPHAGSDLPICGMRMIPLNFNPRPPCGERPLADLLLLCRKSISIHAPHAGSDLANVDFAVVLNISIHAPHAGSDYGSIQRVSGKPISIHAPHAGSDKTVKQPSIVRGHFNPRPPCGERPAMRKTI